MTRERRAWETRLMRAAAAGEPGSDLSVAERAAVEFLLSDDVELDLHTAVVLAELVASDVPTGEQVAFVRMWLRELRDALRRGGRHDTEVTHKRSRTLRPKRRKPRSPLRGGNR